MRRGIIFGLSHSSGLLSSNASLVDATISRVGRLDSKEQQLPQLQERAQASGKGVSVHTNARTHTCAGCDNICSNLAVLPQSNSATAAALPTVAHAKYYACIVLAATCVCFKSLCGRGCTESPCSIASQLLL